VGDYKGHQYRKPTVNKETCMKTFKLTFALILLMLLISFVGLYSWLCNPLDKTAWRIPLHVPIIGVVHVRAFALVQIATSAPGRAILNNTQWHSKHGNVSLKDKSQYVELNCDHCHFYLKHLSEKSIEFDAVTLSVKRTHHQLSGVLTTQSAEQSIRILYSGQASMKGVDLNWSLPNEPIADLLAPLKPQSSTIQKAHVTGTLTANGTLHWPSRVWSAKPTIKNFDVTGLDTETLNTTYVNFQCPNPGEKTTDNTRSPQIWLDKNALGRWLPMATLIAEDAKFMHHPGYDIETLSYLLAQEKPNKQLGGSTISQQLAKYFFTGGERHWKRKIEELLYAVEMESTLGKARILNLYLNTVDWGPGICGAHDASKYYFAVDPQDLTPIQAAWLAGIIRNPHRAWLEQYKANKPDIKRIQAIIRYMPKRVRQLPIQLNFSQPNGA
jgi:glutaredoxin